MTAFSCVLYLNIGGVTVTSDKVKKLTVTYAAEENTLFSGFINGEMKIEIYGDLTFTPGGQVSISASSGITSFSANNFKVSKIKRRGQVVIVTARDDMRELERNFDDSAFDEDEDTGSGRAVQVIAAQCGFVGALNVPSCTLKYADIHGKTCREILRQLSCAYCGVWICTSGRYLTFIPYGSYSFACEPSPDAVFYIHSYRQISGISAYDTETHTLHHKGSGSDITLRGRMLTDDRAAGIMAQLAGKTVRSFYLQGQPCINGVCGVVCISDGNYDYFSAKTVIDVGEKITFSAQFEDLSADGEEYISPVEYKAMDTVQPVTAYGSTIIDSKGLGVLEEDDDKEMREKKAYYFEAAKGKVARFTGAVMDKIMPVSIEKVSDTSRRITYDGVAYLLTYTKTGGTKTNIRLTEISD